jgi:hypothetical protein
MMRRLHFDHLWTLAILALLASFIALVPTPPHDFWWHLRAGQIVATEGIPTTNRFAWTIPTDTPFVYATWLGEWLFYTITQSAGLPGVAITRNLLGLCAFGLVAWDARLRSSSWRLAALAVLLAGLMTISNLPIRTQNWAWVPFAAFTCLLAAYAAGRAKPWVLVLLPVCMAFWVNSHGTFVLGLVLLVIYACGETLRRLLQHERALAWPQLVWLYLASGATLLACFVNPMGFGIFGYVTNLLSDQPVQTLVLEWQSPAFDSLFGKFFYAATIALLAALALARRRPTITDVLLICMFLWLAFDGQRSLIWFGMVAMPILAQSLAATEEPVARESGPVLVNWLIALVLAAGVVVVQPPFKEQLPWPVAYRNAFADVPDASMIFDTTTPVGAVAWLRANPDPAARLFNEMSYGSYLIWALPEVPVFIDPRIELYSLQQWQDYIAITDGTGTQRLLDSYGVTRVLLNRGNQGGLRQVLMADTSGWQLEYRDAWSEVYRRVMR